MRGSEAVVSEVPGSYTQKEIRIISEKLEHQHWQIYILQGSPKTWEEQAGAVQPLRPVRKRSSKNPL